MPQMRLREVAEADLMAIVYGITAAGRTAPPTVLVRCETPGCKHREAPQTFTGSGLVDCVRKINSQGWRIDNRGRFLCPQHMEAAT
jgi:hypothetical protein